MKKKISLSLSILLILLAVLLTFQVTFTLLSIKHRNDLIAAYGSMERYEKLLEVDALFRNLYVEEVDEDALMDGILSGYVYGSGDKFAAYYPAEEFQSYMESLQGEMQGIGIHVVFNPDYQAIEVVGVMPDSPALEAGVQVGDMIAYVGLGETAESVADLGYYGALAKLQGKADTVAEFTAYRGKNYTEMVEFSILRGYIKEQTVTYRTYYEDPSVGIVRIDSFDLETPKQFYDAVNALLKNGCTKLVLDVRYNPGGELTSVCHVLDMLLPEGPVIRTLDRDGKEEVVYTSDANELNMPMAVLVNGSTASAGELFASALQDYEKAVLIGTVTYGKGSMQTIRQLSDGSGLSVTYRYYCPPFSDNYHGVGVQPDVVVEPNETVASTNIYKLADSDDNQLAAAIEELAKRG